MKVWCFVVLVHASVRVFVHGQRGMGADEEKEEEDKEEKRGKSLLTVLYV